ncbi:hypothetical protein SCHPADRAFT_540426 [Schizopora paradoxa]|uniref:Uncharacterized protein n=1 Tax=Schizopora paradoxa TaxID=27342 RepID=A0A0H2REH2_9AGAM|nr:hypothetical protein SCHPADRAFT_540426 [Schizopora paradoxa]
MFDDRSPAPSNHTFQHLETSPNALQAFLIFPLLFFVVFVRRPRWAGGGASEREVRSCCGRKRRASSSSFASRRSHLTICIMIIVLDGEMGWRGRWLRLVEGRGEARWSWLEVKTRRGRR